MKGNILWHFQGIRKQAEVWHQFNTGLLINNSYAISKNQLLPENYLIDFITFLSSLLKNNKKQIKKQITNQQK